MGRVKGSKNKNTEPRPATSSLSTEERILFLANLIIDRIQEDRKNGGILLRKIIGTML